MSDRSRTPTGDQKTSIFAPTSSRSKTPTTRGVGRLELATPTEVSPVELATPTEVSPRQERSEPLRVISMKASERAEATPVPQRLVQLRALSEVSGQHLRPRGNLAPPRDPKQVRARRLRDLLIWGSAVVLVGCAVMLAVWFLARR